MHTPPTSPLDRFIVEAPKTELHLHIEGTLEPELMFALAARNGVTLPFASAEEVRRAYAFTDLQSFLDIYYSGARVLLHEQDFFDLAWAYLERAARENIRHTELFFDPQTHTERGVAYETVLGGLRRALDRAARELGITSRLILCFLRHLSADDAMKTLEAALPHRAAIDGVGLDSSERGNPPSRFTEVFARARAAGLGAVAHAGEEGPPEYVTEALDLLHVSRVDHGVRAIEDAALVRRLAAARTPLTVCPLSNVKLRVFDRLEHHTLKRLLDAGVCVTLNSDDPAYFGGYLVENIHASQRALQLSAADVVKLVENGWEAAWISDTERTARITEVRALASALGL
ncbi:adenosine deaminase [Myxococcota bacterium]|nr:adenosine deaminase [Myxococcota bacterium]